MMLMSDGPSIGPENNGEVMVSMNLKVEEKNQIMHMKLKNRIMTIYMNIFQNLT